MKIFTAIFCLLVSLSARGQGADTSRRDTSKKFIIRDAPTNPDSKPLIILDDVVYKADVNTIDPNSIMSIDVLKGNSATAIYGKQAESGAIIIKTKNYRQIDTAINKNALFVIDGQPSKNKLDCINPNDILTIDILKKGKGSDPSFEPVNDVVIVVTKANAIKQYQKKFSAFSKPYKDYLASHQNSKLNFTYIINKRIIDEKKNEGINELYDLPAQKIKKITFLDVSKYTMGECIIIKTKK